MKGSSECMRDHEGVHAQQWTPSPPTAQVVEDALPPVLALLLTPDRALSIELCTRLLTSVESD